MRLINARVDELPALKNSAVAIGTFDGIHIAHQRLIGMLKEEAKRIGGHSVVFTFDRPPFSKQPLFTKEQKVAAFIEEDVDYLYMAEFDEDFIKITREEFAGYIVEKLDAKVIVVGENFTFGAGAKGNPAFLKEYCKAYGVEVKVLELMVAEGCKVSSSRIRDLILEGDVAVAARLLGKPYELCGIVTEGNRIGRTLGFPTANIAPEGRLYPKNGVYVTSTIVGDEEYMSVTNVGLRPTVGDRAAPNIETHILEGNYELYGQRICVAFWERLRGEVKFDGLPDLKRQIALDKENARRFFGI